MIYAVHFENDPARAEVRKRHRAEHEAYLDLHADRFAAAGILAREGGLDATGEFWLVRADSELEARELVEGDPFFVLGLRRTVRVWRYVPARGLR